MTPLQQVLTEGLATTTRTVKVLKGGLYLVFYPREATFSRIIATRQGKKPSETELAVLRRDLAAILSQTPHVTIGSFRELPQEKGYHAAELWIAFKPTQTVPPMLKESRYE